MGKLILLRGPSGTGKSTIAREIHGRESNHQAKICHFESDQFFVDEETGTYRFNIAKLSAAHRWNQLQVERAMLHQSPIVIVSNTFIAHWEMERYLELAEEYHYDRQLIRTPGPWDADTLFRRNKHNVPMDVLKRHISGFQPHDEDELWTDLSIFK
jgi:predicted kinase